jgi:hypothetical protein
MNNIYNMEMSFKFILQATRILHVGNYDDEDLKMIYGYVISLDKDILNDYYNTSSIFTYANDLELYLEIVNVLIKIYEESEEYEKCFILKLKKDESLEIINENKI